MNPTTAAPSRNEAGKWTVPCACRDCGRTFELEVGNPATDAPNPIAINLAGMVLCESCAEKAEAAELLSETSAARNARLADSKLPGPLRDLSFDEMISEGERERAVERAKAWAENESPGGLVLWGPAGVGKTRLAATACAHRCERWPVRWVSVAVLIAELGAAFSDSHRRQAIETLTGMTALVLDDFDKVNPTEWARNQLFAAVDRRIQHGKPILVTTNLAPARLKEKFGDAISSRLGGMSVVKLDGPDYRLKLDATL